MIINVKFKNKFSGEFDGNSYSYFCDINDVKIGDVVIAPTVHGESEALVCRVNVAESSVKRSILPLLKTIEKRKEVCTDAE